MAGSHEQLHSQIPDSVEEARHTVNDFMQFTKTVLSEESHALDVEWEYQMHRLYGDQDLLRITKNEQYKGVAGIESDLREAYENGGLANLKAVFIVKVVEHTNVASMGDAMQIAFAKIIDFG